MQAVAYAVRKWETEMVGLMFAKRSARTVATVIKTTSLPSGPAVDKDGYGPISHCSGGLPRWLGIDETHQ